MDIITNALGRFLLGLANAIRGLGIKTLNELVWMEGGPPLGTFWSDEWTTLNSWYWTFAMVALAPGLIQAVITVYGLRAVTSSGNSKVREQLYSSLSGILAMFALILFMPLGLRSLLQLNEAIVQLVSAKLGVAKEIFGDISQVETLVQNKLIIGAIHLILVGVELMLNYLYVIRKIVIAASFVLVPLAAWVMVFRYTYTPLLLLLSEIASNAFMQASHAITIAILIELLVKHQDRYPWWIIIMVPTLLPVVSAFIRRLFTGYLNYLGVNEERWAGWASVAAGGLVGITKAASGILAGAGTVGGVRAATGLARAIGGATSRVGAAAAGGAAGAAAAAAGALAGATSGAAGASAAATAGGVASALGSASTASGGGPISLATQTVGPGAVGMLGSLASSIGQAGGPAMSAATAGGSGAGPSALSGPSLGAVSANTRTGSSMAASQGIGGTAAPTAAPSGMGGAGPVPQTAGTGQPGAPTGPGQAGAPAGVQPPTGQQQGAPAPAGGGGGIPPPGPGQGPGKPRSTLAKVGRFAGALALHGAARTAEVAFKGSVLVGSALVGAGLATYGGPHMVGVAMEAGTKVADTVWGAPGRMTVTIKDLLHRVNP